MMTSQQKISKDNLNQDGASTSIQLVKPPNSFIEETKGKELTLDEQQDAMFTCLVDELKLSADDSSYSADVVASLANSLAALKDLKAMLTSDDCVFSLNQARLDGYSAEIAQIGDEIMEEIEYIRSYDLKAHAEEEGVEIASEVFTNKISSDSYQKNRSVEGKATNASLTSEQVNEIVVSIQSKLSESLANMKADFAALFKPSNQAELPPTTTIPPSGTGTRQNAEGGQKADVPQGSSSMTQQSVKSPSDEADDAKEKRPLRRGAKQPSASMSGSATLQSIEVPPKPDTASAPTQQTIEYPHAGRDPRFGRRNPLAIRR